MRFNVCSPSDWHGAFLDAAESESQSLSYWLALACYESLPEGVRRLLSKPAEPNKMKVSRRVSGNDTNSTYRFDLSCPDDWAAAFKRQAKKAKVSRSTWVSDQGYNKLAERVQMSLSSRRGRGRPPKEQSAA